MCALANEATRAAVSNFNAGPTLAVCRDMGEQVCQQGAEKGGVALGPGAITYEALVLPWVESASEFAVTLSFWCSALSGMGILRTHRTSAPFVNHRQALPEA